MNKGQVFIVGVLSHLSLLNTHKGVFTYVLCWYRQEALLSDEQAQEIVAMLSPHALPHDNGVSLNDSYQSVLSYERYDHTLEDKLTKFRIQMFIVKITGRIW